MEVISFLLHEDETSSTVLDALKTLKTGVLFIVKTVDYEDCGVLFIVRTVGYEDCGVLFIVRTVGSEDC